MIRGILKKSMPLLKRNVSKATTRQIVYSRFETAEIPNIPIEQLLWEHLEGFHDKTAIECAITKRTYTYSEVYKKSIALANFLNKLKNLKQVDNAAIILPNVPEYIIVFLGAVQAGVKVAIVNCNSTNYELKHLLTLCEANLIFTTTNCYSTVATTIAHLNRNVSVVIVKTKKDEHLPDKTINFNEIVDGSCKKEFQTEHNFDETIMLGFSSGTTGLPKCVEFTNKNVVSSLVNLTAAPEIKFFDVAKGNHQEVILGNLPFSHVYGLVVVALNALRHGCKIVTMTNFRSSIFLTALNEHPIRKLFLVPALSMRASVNIHNYFTYLSVQLLLHNPQITMKHLSSIETVTSASNVLPIIDIQKFIDKTKGKISVVQMYGLTELTSITHSQMMNNFSINKIGAIGYSLPSVESKILKITDGTELGPNQLGEMYIRGPQVMKGYFKNEEATREIVDREGWVKTGDAGYYDDRGQFYIKSRIKDLIKVSGYQVSPGEIEELLKTHPGVKEAAVVGIPHPKLGEAPKAFVVPKSDTILQPQQLRDYVKENLIHYKHLTGGVAIVNSIPKNSIGKVLKHLLK
ncbi:hypothetical protein FQA39_LY00568 [Lamprigera yunnana]|nr:hypothetical protein FQA39_LY00568 [Lamprigera yunnana]